MTLADKSALIELESAQFRADNVIETALSRPPVGQADSPRTHQQEVIGNLTFPTSKEEFRQYLNRLSLEQRFQEANMFREDLEMAALEFAEFLGLQSFGSVRSFFEDKQPVPRGTVVGLTGFNSHESSFWGLRDYLKPKGYRVVTFRPEAMLNIKPLEQLVDPLMDFLLKVKDEIGNQELHIVAHSKGAILNMVAAIKYRDIYRRLVSKKINLGGPVPTWVNPGVGRFYLGYLYFFGGDDFKLSQLRDSLGMLDDMDFTSIGNPYDRIIKGIHAGTFIQFSGSHLAMPFNRREVLPKIPQILEGLPVKL